MMKLLVEADCEEDFDEYWGKIVWNVADSVIYRLHMLGRLSPSNECHVKLVKLFLEHAERFNISGKVVELCKEFLSKVGR